MAQTEKHTAADIYAEAEATIAAVAAYERLDPAVAHASARTYWLGNIEVKEMGDAQPFLHEPMRQIVDGALLILQRLAGQFPIGDSLVTVSGWISYEDDINEIVLTHWMLVPEEVAFAYWEQLAVATNEYIGALPVEWQVYGDGRLSVAVNWLGRDPAL